MIGDVYLGVFLPFLAMQKEVGQGVIMTDPPKQVFSIISYALIALFVISILVDERLPEKILGVSTVIWQICLIISAYLVRMGWRVVEWFRRRN